MFRRGRKRKAAIPEYLERGYAAHRRNLRWRIIFPVGIAGLAIVLVPLLVLMVGGESRLGTTAALMSVCALLPAMIFLIVIYAVLLGATFYTAKAYSKTSGALKRVHGAVHSVNVATSAFSQRITAPLVAISARLAFLQRALGGKPPSALPQKREDS